MFCNNCGKVIQEGSRFCNSCGASVQAPAAPGAAAGPAQQAVPQQPAYPAQQPGYPPQQPYAAPPVQPVQPYNVVMPQPGYYAAQPSGMPSWQQASYPQAGMQPRIGFSPKINDPAFARYVKHSNMWAGIFSSVLAIGVITGFTIYGEKSTEMGNPQAFFIGLGIGGMFLLIAAVQILKRKGGKTWDGQVVDKTIEHKRRREEYGDDHYRWVNYTVYTVHIAGNDGKRHKISVENSDKWYNYYNVGDRLRYHGKLSTYEKYDKTYDSIIFCNACSTENDINSDVCRRCKCPLLK